MRKLTATVGTATTSALEFPVALLYLLDPWSADGAAEQSTKGDGEGEQDGLAPVEVLRLTRRQATAWGFHRRAREMHAAATQRLRFDQDSSLGAATTNTATREAVQFGLERTSTLAQPAAEPKKKVGPPPFRPMSS